MKPNYPLKFGYSKLDIRILFYKHYLGYNSVIETSYFVILEIVSICNNLADGTLLYIKLAGCVGAGRATELLLSMRRTEIMFGLSTTFS